MGRIQRWQRRFEKLGIEPYRESGEGRFYRIDLSRYTLSLSRKRKMTAKQREAAAERMRALNSA